MDVEGSGEEAEAKKDFRLSQNNGQLQKLIWSKYGLSLEKFFCIENKICTK